MNSQSKKDFSTLLAIVGVFLCALSLTAVAHAQGPVDSVDSVDVESLIRECSLNSQELAFAGYSYKLEFTRRSRALIGTRKQTKRYEAILPYVVPKNRRFSHPLLLTYDSSKNLTSEEIVSERRRIVKMLEQIENGDDSGMTYEDRNAGGYVALMARSKNGGKNIKIDLIALLNNSVFTEPKQISANGRPTVLLEFRPSADATYSLDLEYLEKIGGLIFIDKEDKRIVAVEGFPLDIVERMKGRPPDERDLSSVFSYYQTRVPEGYWFPSRVKIDFLDAPNGLREFNVAVDFLFSDYQRAQTEVRSAEVEPVPDSETDH